MTNGLCLFITGISAISLASCDLHVSYELLSTPVFVSMSLMDLVENTSTGAGVTVSGSDRLRYRTSGRIGRFSGSSYARLHGPFARCSSWSSGWFVVVMSRIRGQSGGGMTSAAPPLAVFGLGYVGTVSAACFAELGHRVVGVDVNPDKVAMVNQGRAPLVEDQIGELTGRAVASGRLVATTDARAAVAETEIALVCVGTLSLPTGAPALTHLERVADQIGAALPDARTRYTVAIRSTILPGTCAEVVVPRLEKASGLVAGHDFGVCVNPEFLREGSSVADFFSPSRTVIGQLDQRSGDRVEALYAGLPGPRYRLPLATAEMVKYVDNAFHALKVGFANEVGALCKALGLDSHEVMDIFCDDRKLNISPAYLRPGFAFGGSCLPKDLRALVHAARHNDLRLPILEDVL